MLNRSISRYSSLRLCLLYLWISRYVAIVTLRWNDDKTNKLKFTHAVTRKRRMRIRITSRHSIVCTSPKHPWLPHIHAKVRSIFHIIIRVLYQVRQKNRKWKKQNGYGFVYTYLNEKFWEELVYFPLTRHGLHRKRCIQQFLVAAVTFSPSRCLTIGEYTYRHTDWCEGFMKYAVKMGSGAMIYIPSFMKIGWGIQKEIGGDSETHRQHGDLCRLKGWIVLNSWATISFVTVTLWLAVYRLSVRLGDKLLETHDQ
jgi:hypothetical protein